ncbi:MAG: 1-deoxy-D-xylulose-5-phosphate reductoisomerase [Ignavibacteriales bacterium]|nr:1-deoxy-D-xylulose-5-phosphate reductoisomerase [Ignavibacteriales bacterium]
MKKILILGSTGSIGVNTLEIVRSFPQEFEITGLTANTNIELLEKQIEEFHPKIVAVRDELKSKELKQRIGNKCEVLSGNEGLLEITRRGDYGILVSAMVGFAGLAPTIEAINLNKRIALANKETLVTAGQIVIDLCKKYNSELIPIDSEHSAIFQCLKGEEQKEIQKIILTASGGPFLNKSENDLKKVTVEEALKHPNWKMGNKITIDSATMMNKGLEVIEAFWLFNLTKEQIEVIIHPQSIIHSMVEFIDGSIKAQLSSPDMKLPIIYALSYPERYYFKHVQTDFRKINQLTFFEPDFDKFACLKIAYDVIAEGGTASCILNAANEVAVEKFLCGKIKFIQIPEMITEALNKIDNHKDADLETIVECDFRTREFLLKKYN